MSEKKAFDKDIELLKIQILADHYQARVSFLGSVITGAIIGLIVVVVTLSLENVLSLFSYIIILVVYNFFIYEYIRDILDNYRSSLDKISNLVSKVQNGETLPSITELRKTKLII